MVQALHSAGIGVIMDVVYNHTYTGEDSFFNLTVPNYYYRINEDGTWSNNSGCGNDTASEHAMYSKFMVDSVYYWATEYHIDGFRFDLMGLHDVDTMNKIREKLNTIDKRIIMYGEAWDLGYVEDVDLAIQKNIDMMDGIAAFNDGMRDAVKGDNFEAVGKGYVQGKGGTVNIENGVKAATNEWAVTPKDTVTYASCHDNMTFYDKLVASVLGTKNSSLYRQRNEQLVKMNKLGAACILTSQGMSFMLAGEEMARSKDGDHNSYVSSPQLNQIDWNNLTKYGDLTAYYKGLIDLRKSYAPFTDSTKATINNMTVFENTDKKVLGFMMTNTLTKDTQWDKVVCIYNADTEKDIEVQLEGDNLPNSWVVVVDNLSAGVESLKTVEGTKVTVPRTSAMVLVDKESFDKAGIKLDSSFKDKLIKNTVFDEEKSTQLATTGEKNIVKVDNDGKMSKIAGIIAGVAAGVVATAVIAGVVILKKKKRK